MWGQESWLSLGVKPLPARTSVSSAWIFCHVGVHRSADRGREDQAHGEAPGVAAVETQGLEGVTPTETGCQLIFLQSLGVSLGILLLSP